MKKFLSFAAFAMFACALTFVSCGSDDDDNDNSNPTPTPSDQNKDAGGENANANDLIGVWEAIGEQVKSVYTFTDKELTIEDYYLDYQTNQWKKSEQEDYKGAYTLNNGILSYIMSYNQQQVEWRDTVEVVAKLLYNKTALALLSSMRNDQGDEYSVNQILYKKGANIPAKIEDIQGDWRWYMHGDKTYTRVAVQIKDNNMTLIIVPWGQRYDGTITYENGYINMKVEAAYTSREEGTGEGWGEGDLNPETLEANWKTLNRDSWMYYEIGGMPFVVDGNEAYGTFANLHGIYYKFNVETR